MPRVSEIDSDRGHPIAGYENMRSKMNVALGVEAQGFCVIAANPAVEGGTRR
jgi:hypothetical protein